MCEKKNTIGPQLHSTHTPGKVLKIPKKQNYLIVFSILLKPSLTCKNVMFTYLCCEF